MLLSRRGSKYWDVIYGYKYWRSLKHGKRIVEFAGNGSFRRNECSLFSFCLSLARLPPPPLPLFSRPSVAFRAVSDRKSNPRFTRRTDWSTCLRVGKPFLRNFFGNKKYHATSEYTPDWIRTRVRAAIYPSHSVASAKNIYIKETRISTDIFKKKFSIIFAIFF